MLRVRDILAAKGDRVVTTKPFSSVKTIAQILRVENIGALVVTEDGDSVVGIVSERDVVHGFTVHGERLADKTAGDIMTREALTCGLEDAVKDVMAKMTRHRVRHLPVLREGRLAGLVSIGDVVKSRLDEAELETSVMRDYVVSH